MKVVLVTSSTIPHVGGLSTHCELLKSELLRTGSSVMPVSADQFAQSRFSASYVVLRLLCRDRARATTLNKFTVSLARSVRTVIDDTSPDIIHSHDAIATCAALSAQCGRPHIPVVQTIHGPLSREALTCGSCKESKYITTLRRFER